ncbi:rRNA-processing protein utp21 [Balamuthia mandrillaris]
MEISFDGGKEEEEAEELLLTSLPVEVILHVLSYVGAADLCSFGATNNTLRSVSSDETLWKGLFLRNFSLLSFACSSSSSCFSSSSSSSKAEIEKDGLLMRGTTNEGRWKWRDLFMRRCRTRKNWREGNWALKASLSVGSPVYAVRFDDHKVVAGLQNSAIKVLHKYSGQTLLQLDGHGDWIGAVQYDDEKVVSCSGDHSVRVWNWDGKCVYRTRKHTGWVKRLQYTQELLATGSGDSTVKLWRWSPGWKYMPKDSEEHNEQDDTCDDGELQENAKERSSLLPTTKRDEPLPIPKCVRTLAGHQQGIMGLQFDRNTLVSSSLRGNIRVWDIESGKCLHEINAPSELRCVAFDENDIVAGDRIGHVTVWDRATGELKCSLDGHTGYVKFVHIDATKIVSGGGDGAIKVWDRKVIPTASTNDAEGEFSPHYLYSIAAHERDIINMDIHEDEVFTASTDSSMKLYSFLHNENSPSYEAMTT